jgi:hypothetical protein
MTTGAVRRDRGMSSRGQIIQAIRLHIRCRPHTTLTLAKKLGVSVASVARGIAELRRILARGGESLVSIKEGSVWHYEIRENEQVWENDPFFRAVGSIKGVRPPAGESVDDALYGKVKATP